MREPEAQEIIAWLSWIIDDGYCSPNARKNITKGINYYKRCLNEKSATAPRR